MTTRSTGRPRRPTLKPIRMTRDEFAAQYGLVCDALCRALWADMYGIEPDDGILHTSDEARRVALAVFEALRIEEDEPEIPSNT